MLDDVRALTGGMQDAGRYVAAWSEAAMSQVFRSLDAGAKQFDSPLGRLARIGFDAVRFAGLVAGSRAKHRARVQTMGARAVSRGV